MQEQTSKPKSFEVMAAQLLKLALEIDAEQDDKKGEVHDAVAFLRRELIVMLDISIKSLSRVFKL